MTSRIENRFVFQSFLNKKNEEAHSYKENISLIKFYNFLIEQKLVVGNIYPLNNSNFYNNNFLYNARVQAASIRSLLSQNKAMFARISELDLSNMELKYLPKELYKYFYNLKVLDISKNELTEFPEEISNLSLLEYLDFSQNCFEESFPKEVGSLTNLHTLKAINNGFNELPEEIGNLVNLEELIIPENYLIEIPASFANLRKLKVLNLQNNELVKLCDNFDRLFQLKILNLSDNHLRNLPEFGVNWDSLEELNVTNNPLGINRLPETLGDLNKLEILVLSNTGIDKLPESIGKLSNLTIFHAASNAISQIPETFEKLGNLEEVIFADNRLEQLSKKIPKKIRYLDLSQNNFSIFPLQVEYLSQLRYLDIRENKIQGYPSLKVFKIENFHFDQYPAMTFTDPSRLITSLWRNETGLPQVLQQDTIIKKGKRKFTTHTKQEDENPQPSTSIKNQLSFLENLMSANKRHKSNDDDDPPDLEPID